jgi:hypothetical protein
MSNGVAPQGHRLDDVTSSSWNRSSLRGAKFVPELPETCRSAYGLGLLSTGGSSTQQAAAPLDHDVMWRDRANSCLYVCVRDAGACQEPKDPAY